VNVTSWVRCVGVALLAVVLQVSVFDEIVLFGAHPDGMIVLAAAGGIIAGSRGGAIIGFVAGCFADLAVALPFGIGPITGVCIGFGASFLYRATSGRDVPAAGIATVALLAAVGTVLYAVIAAAIGQPGMLGSACVRATIVVGLGGAVLALPALAIARWIIGPSTATLGGIGAA
jgi:rod shape-determining protein MreD